MKKVIILGLMAMGAIEAAPVMQAIDMYRIPNRKRINDTPSIHEHEIRATTKNKGTDKDCSLLGYFYTGEKGYLQSKLHPKGGLRQCGNIIPKTAGDGIAVYVYDNQYCPYARQYAHDLSAFDFYHFALIQFNANKYGANSDAARGLSEILETFHIGCPVQQQAGPAE